MRKKTILRQLYLSCLLIILVTAASLSLYASRVVREFHLEQRKTDLAARAHLVASRFPKISEADSSRVDALCKELGRNSSTRITVILPSGKVLGDSDENPARMDSHADRPEVVAALTGKEGVSTRYSYTLHKKMLYVAVPLTRDGSVTGVVRTAMPLVSINESLFRISSSVVFGGIVVAIIAAAFSLVVSRRITRPLAELREGAERFAKGDLNHKLAVPDSQEIGALADAMNRMAAELDQKIHAAVQQRNEQEAVLSSMTEGVIAVDSEERLINVNHAASLLLGISPAGARGRSIQETVRNVSLQLFVRRALMSDEAVETDFVLHDHDEKFIHARATTLRDSRGRCIGAVLVLSDATTLRRLENMRRDFVANVSHELKTPITSIKGFIETLSDGAIRDHEAAHRFLSIIAKQADRLNSLIDDLLTLAKIEQEAEREEVALAPAKILPVVEAAVQACEQKAAEKDIAILVTCPESLEANINPPLFEQALINLIDNAIKYSESGKTVAVEADKADSETTVSVRDEGCGIEEKHLPRLFERFYRVDKARSRKMGGTGLGLAIVKHITQAHGGRVRVQSVPRKGSTFTIHLPGFQD